MDNEHLHMNAENESVPYNGTHRDKYAYACLYSVLRRMTLTRGDLGSDHRMVPDHRSLVWGFQLLLVGLQICVPFDCLDGLATTRSEPLSTAQNGSRAPPDVGVFR